MADQRFQNVINGELVDSVSGETYDVIDPTTGEVYAVAPMSGAEDVDRAYAAAAAAFAAIVETVGGAALIIGLLTPVVAALNIVNLLGAFVFVHASQGVFVDGGGYELVLALIAGLVVVALLGAGRFSVDGLVVHRRQVAATA